MLDAFASLDIDTHRLRIEFELTTSSGYPSNQYDIEYTANGTVYGYCDEQGLVIDTQYVTWEIQDPFNRYDVTVSASTSWAPPRVLLPGRPEIGDHWINNSVQTTTAFANGESTITVLDEDLEIVDMRTLDRTVAGSVPTLVVQGQDGHRVHYAEGVGLMLGDALVRTIASCCGYD